jgi:succinate dehydrogenase / fumarate reductase membrane anchor subunit
MTRKLGLWPWFFQRVTAVYLAVGMIAHFYVLHFSGAEATGFGAVTARFREPAWFCFDMSLLVTALYHGLNGLWNIMLDYGLDGTPRKVIGWCMFGIGVVGVGVGFATLRAFAMAN